MSDNLILITFSRVIPGREISAARLAADLTAYLDGLAKTGAIESWEWIVVDRGASNVRSLFIVRGTSGGLAAVAQTDEWITLMDRSALNVENFAVATAVTGSARDRRVELYAAAVGETFPGADLMAAVGASAPA